jgi:isochorismate synthase
MTATSEIPRLSGALVELARVAAETSRSHRNAAFVALALPGEMVRSLVRDVGVEGLRAAATVTWEQPSDGIRLFGLGEALRLRGNRDSALEDARRELAAVSVALAPGVSSTTRPRFFGGCRFEPNTLPVDDAWDAFGGWQFVLPRLLVSVTSEGPGATLCVPVAEIAAEHALTLWLDETLRCLFEPLPRHALAGEVAPTSGAGLGPEAWQDAVAHAVAEIDAGAFEKVVLARRSDYEQPEPIDSPAVLRSLGERYPGCRIFSFRAGDSTWLGASPELLVELEQGTVRAASLAGSRPRGDDPIADRRLAEELLDSRKERAEHGFVVSAIAGALAPVCSGVEMPPAPSLMRMANIQHLYTPVTGIVRPGVDILDLVSRVHPTPAVGGWPRESTFDAIRRLEQMDRGWYAAPIGWVDLNGDGEFAVALRSARVSGSRATLFAGAGIVAGSVPEQELAEIELKFRPMREALKRA